MGGGDLYWEEVRRGKVLRWVVKILIFGSSGRIREKKKLVRKCYICSQFRSVKKKLNIKYKADKQRCRWVVGTDSMLIE